MPTISIAGIRGYLLSTDDPLTDRYLTCCSRSHMGNYPYDSGSRYLKSKYLRVGTGSICRLTCGVPYKSM